MSIGDYTENFNLPLSNFDTPLWTEEDWSRWRLVDALIASVSDVAAPYVVATGAANAFVLTYDPPITAYTNGLVLQFKANEAVTGASTVNVNGLGVKTLKLNGIDTIEGDIPDETYVRILYDGTNFAVIAPRKPVNMDRNISTGDSGCTPNAATDFYVESTAPTYVELLGPDASTQGFMFSRPSLGYAGGIKYDHVNDLLILRVGGNDAWTCDEDGNVNAFKFIGSFQGNLVGAVTGNVTGNAATATKLATSRTISFTSDVTGTGSFDGSANYSAALTIAAGVVTNAKLSTVATQTIKGRSTAGTGAPEDLTPTQVTALLNVFGTAKGLAPSATAGDATAEKFLFADATWKSVFACKGSFTGATGAVIAARGFTVSRIGVGDYLITFTTPFADTNYIPIFKATGNAKLLPPTISSQTTTTIAIACNKINDAFTGVESYDPITVFFAAVA